MSEGRSQGPVAARSSLGCHSCYNPWSELQPLGVSTVRRLALLLSVHCPLFAWTASDGGLKGRGFRGRHLRSSTQVFMRLRCSILVESLNEQLRSGNDLKALADSSLR